MGSQRRVLPGSPQGLTDAHRVARGGRRLGEGSTGGWGECELPLTAGGREEKTDLPGAAAGLLTRKPEGPRVLRQEAALKWSSASGRGKPGSAPARSRGFWNCEEPRARPALEQELKSGCSVHGIFTWRG